MNPVKCPKCGKINDGHLDFCIYCGAIFEEAKPENDENVIDQRFRIRKAENPLQISSDYWIYHSDFRWNFRIYHIHFPNHSQRPLCQKARLYTTQHFNLLGNADQRFGFNRPDGSKRFVKSNEYNTTRESDSECKCKFNQHIWIVSYLFFPI